MRPPASASSRWVKIDGTRFFAVRSISRARQGMNTGSVTTSSALTRSLTIAEKAPSKSSGPRNAGDDLKRQRSSSRIFV